MELQRKRMYEPPGDDVWRVLVDRLWPRGVSKEHPALDLWDRDVAPTDPLRVFQHATVLRDLLPEDA